MNEKISSEDFDKGVNLFVEILKAQPGLLKLEAGVNDIKGQELANMAVAFSRKYNELKAKHALA